MPTPPCVAVVFWNWFSRRYIFEWWVLKQMSDIAGRFTSSAIRVFHRNTGLPEQWVAVATMNSTRLRPAMRLRTDVLVPRMSIFHSLKLYRKFRTRFPRFLPAQNHPNTSFRKLMILVNSYRFHLDVIAAGAETGIFPIGWYVPTCESQLSMPQAPYHQRFGCQLSCGLTNFKTQPAYVSLYVVSTPKDL